MHSNVVAFLQLDSAQYHQFARTHILLCIYLATCWLAPISRSDVVIPMSVSNVSFGAGSVLMHHLMSCMRCRSGVRCMKAMLLAAKTSCATGIPQPIGYFAMKSLSLANCTRQPCIDKTSVFKWYSGFCIVSNGLEGQQGLAGQVMVCGTHYYAHICNQFVVPAGSRTKHMAPKFRPHGTCLSKATTTA